MQRAAEDDQKSSLVESRRLPESPRTRYDEGTQYLANPVFLQEQFIMIIHSSPLPEVDIPNVTITAHVLRKADALADQVAIRDAAGASAYTYAELSDKIHALAGGLASRGIAPGKVVGLMAPNLPEYAIVFHGVAVGGRDAMV